MIRDYFAMCVSVLKVGKQVNVEKQCFSYFTGALAPQSHLKMCHRHIFYGVTHRQLNPQGISQIPSGIYTADFIFDAIIISHSQPEINRFKRKRHHFGAFILMTKSSICHPELVEGS